MFAAATSSRRRVLPRWQLLQMSALLESPMTAVRLPVRLASPAVLRVAGVNGVSMVTNEPEVGPRMVDRTKSN